MGKSDYDVVSGQRPAEFDRYLAAGSLHLQQCRQCGYLRYPLGAVCPECLSDAWRWSPCTGRGIVRSLVWYMQPVDARFSDTPYCVVLVELDEGPRMIANLVDAAPEREAVGDCVHAVFGMGMAGRTVVNFKATDVER